MHGLSLTRAARPGYSSPVAGKQPATGGDSPNTTAAKAVTALHDGFFASGVSSMGDRMEGAFWLAGCRSRSVNLHLGRPPRSTAGRAGQSRIRSGAS